MRVEPHSCPYTGLADHAYWRRSVGNVPPAEIDPVVGPKFLIESTHKIATAGSCFAQHISRFIKENGYNFFVPEAGHALLSTDVRREFNYGTFSARYGNIYTTRQLIQLLERAYGLRKASDDVWETRKGFIDPYRPYIQDNGFASMEEFQADRLVHYEAVRQIVEKSDIFVFTLGLTECWENVEDGMVYPVCPGCGVGTFDAERHRFRNLNVSEVIADLHAAIEFLSSRNPSIRILLTVSPVPLIATYAPSHVLVSTTYSKSVLRVAAQDAKERFPNVDYFPSYEIITGPSSRGAYYGPDLREIENDGVAHAMRCFFRHYLGAVLPRDSSATDPQDKKAPGSVAPTGESTIGAKISNIVCDEEHLARFG